MVQKREIWAMQFSFKKVTFIPLLNNSCGDCLLFTLLNLNRLLANESFECFWENLFFSNISCLLIQTPNFYSGIN
jgi:hypothetical protein